MHSGMILPTGGPRYWVSLTGAGCGPEDTWGHKWRGLEAWRGMSCSSRNYHPRASSHVEMSLHWTFSLLLLTTKSPHVTYTDPTLLYLAERSYWLICGFYTLPLHLSLLARYFISIPFPNLFTHYPCFLLCSQLILVCLHSSHHDIVFHDHWHIGKWL